MSPTTKSSACLVSQASAPARPLRVVLLLEDLCFGGTQRQALELARRLCRERVRVSLWVMLQGRDFAPLAEEWGLDVHWISEARTLGVRELWRLKRRLRRERPDVLVLLTALPNIWGRLLGRLTGIPVLVGNIRQSGAPRRYHERLLKNLAHHHICNAQALKELLVEEYGIPPERVSVIHNGVDVERFRPLPGVCWHKRSRHSPVVMSVGRLVPDKDQETMLRAFASVAAENPRVELHLYGDGPLRGELERRRGELPAHVARRTHLLPGRLDLERVYPKAFLFALSSLREGLPNVVLEAMASGLPVVSTAVDGVPEVVRPGVTGLLTPPGDAEALAEAMHGLLRTPELAAGMGRAGRERAERKFAFCRVARRHEELLARLRGRGDS